MTETFDWVREAQALKARLGSIEQAAGQGVIPPEALLELRSAVDHCRVALWMATTSNNTEFGSTAAILGARLSRVQEMCDRIVEEVVAGRVGAETPGLGRFVATLGATEQYVRSLLEQSAATQSR